MSNHKVTAGQREMSPVPGGFNAATSAFELDYWENFGGVAAFDLHFAAYSKCFPMAELDFGSETVLDIGSGAVSVFEITAPSTAQVTAYDLLANEYNRIAPHKNFQIQDVVPETAIYSLITLFNMIDHVIEPGEILEFAARHLNRKGRLWLAVHLYQPHGPKGHPQNFSCGSIIDLVAAHFTIMRCGVIRESVPIPYLWFGELRLNESQQPQLPLAWFKAKIYLKYWASQSTRAAAKVLKKVGLKRLLPTEWQF